MINQESIDSAQSTGLIQNELQSDTNNALILSERVASQLVSDRFLFKIDRNVNASDIISQRSLRSESNKIPKTQYSTKTKYINLFQGYECWQEVNISGQQSALNIAHCNSNSQKQSSTLNVFNDVQNRIDSIEVESVDNLSFLYDSSNDWFDVDSEQITQLLLTSTK